MAFWREADIDTMLAGLGGVPVVHGLETGMGLLESFDEHLLAGQDASLIGKVSALTVKTSAFPTLKVGEPVTVAGSPYTVTDRLRLEDGALTKLLLQG